MTSHTPPEGAVEAGARAWQDDWDALESHVQDACRVVVVDIFTAAHEAGEIVWREEHARMEAAAHQMLEERNDALDAKDEAVALLREWVGWPTDPDTLLAASESFLATQEDRA